MARNRLYISLGFLLLAGYTWLFWNVKYTPLQDSSRAHTLCMFRRFTGIPCPACGSTHSLIALSHGRFIEAMQYNPIGFILGLGMFVVPVWILADLLNKKESFYTFYRRFEALLREKWVAIPVILLIACNWIWNIYKYTR